MIGIIGAGFYGSYIALTLANKGHKVLLIDPEDNTSATLHCQARLHSGMFYVRSIKDLVSCARNFTKFVKVFKPYIYKHFNSYYLVDSKSKVSLYEYKNICRDNNLSVKEVKLDYINPKSIQGILKAKEFSIDTKGLLTYLRTKCKEHKNITFVTDRIINLSQDNKVILEGKDVYTVDKCILAAYTNNFKFLDSLGYTSPSRISYTIPVINYTDNLPKDCHAVVDGNYWSSIVSKNNKILTNLYDINNLDNYYEKSLSLMRHYIPEIEVNFLEKLSVTKTVLANSREATVAKYGNIYTVFSGKLSNIFDIINQIEEI